MTSLFFSATVAATLFASIGNVPKAMTTVLPATMDLDGHPALAEGAAPDASHPWGTVYVAWSGGDHLHLTEWDLSKGSIVRDAEVTGSCREVSLVRAADRLIVACTNESVRVLETDLAGAIVAQGTTGAGELAAIDADGEHVVVGQIVDQKPVLPMRGSSLGPPRSAVKVTVLERRTLATTASKMFRGDHLFYPHEMPQFAAHSVALLGDRVVVQIPDDKPRVEALSVGSLKRLAVRDLPLEVPTEHQHSMPVSRVGDAVAVDGLLLDKDLRKVGTSPVGFYMGSIVARDPSTKTWLVAATLRESTKDVLATTGMDASSVIWSHGRAVAIARSGGEDEPARIRVWNLPK